jgi:hypothetical protein
MYLDNNLVSKLILMAVGGIQSLQPHPKKRGDRHLCITAKLSAGGISPKEVKYART